MSAGAGGAVEWLLNQRQPERQSIGVIGAGTMGAGIAQVAAAAGHPVWLMDARPDAASEAHRRIGASLDGRVAKGRMTAQDRDQLLARVMPVAQLADLKDAVLVIEVIVEQLQAKQALLRELETHVSQAAILASNTSSISITALANGLAHPERLVGMHFFNPVPSMKLVEVVSGAETAASVAAIVQATAERWGKVAVHAKSTPGFIVNRIARPFYAEALALLQEQAGSPADLDRTMRGAGFRMGPCELMDLIGHDINYAVTVSVFDANYGDRRYVPSLIQKALLDGGRLGRKTGQGFYADAALPASPAVVAAASPEAVLVAGQGALAQRLAAYFDAAQVPIARNAAVDWTGLQVGAIELHVTDGSTANQLAARRGTRQLGVIDLPLLAKPDAGLAVAFADGVSQAQRGRAMAALAACRLRPVALRDVAGLVVARTIAMLINEGADAVYQGVCDEAGAELAMTLGTNYPAGPFDWLRQIGVDYVVTVLNHLADAYRSERYRVSPLLQQRYWATRIPS